MFGLEKKVKVMINACKTKSVAIMAQHAALKPADIPKVDLARSLVLIDIAEILAHLLDSDSPRG